MTFRDFDMKIICKLLLQDQNEFNANDDLNFLKQVIDVGKS